MPTLADIHKKIQGNGSTADIVRRDFLKRLHRLTGRPTIIYASSYSIKDIPGPQLQINRHDVQAFMSALVDIKGDQLDLIIHSGGGQAEAAEQIVNYLRAKFTGIRVIIPQNAMSAATMLACAADEIVMGKHSAIGPIDPQLTLPGKFPVAAHSLIDEFLAAQTAIQQGADPILWIEKFRDITPGLLIECQKVMQLAKSLVENWLFLYMFQRNSTLQSQAHSIAEWLGDPKNFLSHGRPISAKEASAKGLKVIELESDQKLQDAVLSVFHATVATFQSTHCCKIVENHLGKGQYLQATLKA